MRALSALLILTLPLTLMAEEVAAEAVSEAASASDSLSPMQALIVGAIVAVVGWVMKLWRGKTKAEHRKIELDASKSLLEQKEILLRRLNDAAARIAETWVEDNLYALAKDAIDGGGFDAKGHFQRMYKHVYAELKVIFQDEGLDILAVIGEPRLQGMVKAAIQKAVSAAPEKVKSFLPPALVEKVSEIAADFVADKTTDWLTDKLGSKPAA